MKRLWVGLNVAERRWLMFWLALAFIAMMIQAAVQGAL